MFQEMLLTLDPDVLPSEQERQSVYFDLYSALVEGSMLLCVGNGGSMVQAQHLAEELAGKFDLDRAPFNSIAVCDPSFLTCVANDYGFDKVFSRAVEAHCREGDRLILFSTSGRSENLLRAAESAQRLGIQTTAFLGSDDSPLESVVATSLRTGNKLPRHLIQVVHTLWIHELLFFVESRLHNGSNLSNT